MTKKDKRVLQIMFVIMLGLCAIMLNIRVSADTERSYVRDKLSIVYTDTIEFTEAVVVTPEPTPEPLPTEDVEHNASLIAVNVFPEPTPEPTPEPVYQEPVYETNSDGWTYYGVCTITHYCSCSVCCGQYASGYTASGTYATAGRTVAMSGLPFGTHVLVNGQEYIVEDRGVGGMWVDIFVSSHEEAYARGMFEAEVWIKYPQ